MRRGDFVRTRVMGQYGEHLINIWAYKPKQKVHSMVDVSKLKFTAGFAPRDLKLVLDKGHTIICAFSGTWKGRETFNIRELYEEYGEWCPGKGIMVPQDQKAELLTALKDLWTAEYHLKPIK